MKDIFELANTTTTDVTAITPKVISATIEEIARAKRVFAQFYKENRDLMNTGGTQVEFPKKGSGVVVQTGLSAGSTLDTGKITYDATTIAIQKSGIGIGFNGEALRQVRRDIIRDAIQEAGEAWADSRETLAIEAMFPTVNIVASGASTVTATGTIIIGIKSTVGPVSSVIIDTNSAVVFGGAGTVTAWYIPTTAGARATSATGGSLSPKDILAGRTSIVSHNYDPDIIIINPKRLADILYDPAVNFVQSWAYRGEGPVVNGEIGQIWGMKVVVTNKCPTYGVIMLDSENLGYNVKRLELELKKDEYSGMKTDSLYFWGFAEENFGVVNNEAYGAVAVKGTFTPEVNSTR